MSDVIKRNLFTANPNEVALSIHALLNIELKTPGCLSSIAN